MSSIPPAGACPVPGGRHVSSRAFALLLLIPTTLAGNPTGHVKLAMDGQKVEGEEIYPNESPVLVTETGKTIFSSGERLIQGMPGGLESLLGEDEPLPGNRVITLLDDDGYAINKRGDVLFSAYTDPVGAGSEKQAIYLKTGGKVLQVALHGASAPGGGLYNLNSHDLALSNNGKYIVFRTSLSGGAGEGIYLGTVGSGAVAVKKVAVIGNAAPEGGSFADLSVGSEESLMVNSSGVIVFRAQTNIQTDNSAAWFYQDGSGFGVIPGAEWSSELHFSDSGNVLFRHAGFFGGFLGDMDSLAYGTVDFISNIVTEGDITPDGLMVFSEFSWEMMDPEGRVTFTGDIRTSNSSSSDAGIFRYAEGETVTIMRVTDSPPGGGLFVEPLYFDLYPVASHGSQVIFKAETSGGNALFRGDGEKLVRVIGQGDVLEGKVVNDVVPAWGGEKRMAGQGAYNSKGQIVYYAELDGANGLFITPFTAVPEIAVEQPVGTGLNDGKSNKGFGTASVGKKGISKTFIIRNKGSDALKNLKIALNGAGAGDFIVSNLTAKSVASGGTATFKVTFAPTKKGTRKATIRISSNDKDENPFDINVTGEGVKR